MRRRVWTCTAALVAAAGLGLSLGAAEPPDNAPWDRIKSLVGTWQGTFEGKPARVSYALVSDGAALLETLESHDSSQMVTVYHPDGASLLLTHYCSSGSQSRMRARKLEGDRLAFAFVDATNVSSPDQHRMTHLVLALRDPDHLVQDWTAKAGALEHTSRFELTRKR